MDRRMQPPHPGNMPADRPVAPSVDGVRSGPDRAAERDVGGHRQPHGLHSNRTRSTLEEWQQHMFQSSRTTSSVIYWPDRLREYWRPLARAVREIAHGVDTWSAIAHGAIPLGGDRQEQLALRGDIDALTAMADAGDEYANTLLARLLADGRTAR